MSESNDAIPRDEGINEVLKMTNGLTINGVNSEETSKSQEQNLNLNHNEMVHSGSSSGACGRQIPSGMEGDAPDVDLSDPDKVLQLLETVDLSEEDTELLLQEAYKMNRQLKEILRHQETSSCPPDIQRQKTKSRLNKQKQSTASPSHSGSRSESGTFSASKKPLPPIHSSDIYTLKLKRSHTNIPVVTRQSTSMVERSKTAKMPARTDSRSSQAKTKPKAPEEKPDWNNRFNYT